MTGTGGCSAFSGAIKTGTLSPISQTIFTKHNHAKLTSLLSSCIELPRQPWHSNCIAIGRLWIERLVLVQRLNHRLQR